MIKQFKIGDIVVAKEGDNGYLITTAKNQFVGKVVELIERGYPDNIKLEVLETKDGFNVGEIYSVQSQYFEIKTPVSASDRIQKIVEEFNSERETLLKTMKTYTDNTSKLEEQLSQAVIENEKDMILNSAIKKAIVFVESNKRVNNVLGEWTVDVHFVENEEKRTVVAIGRGYETGKFRHKAIAKCLPNEVFNVHIGRAIALGRLMGVDVSEYTSLPNHEVK